MNTEQAEAHLNVVGLKAMRSTNQSFLILMFG